jgi:hypothetical protein
MFKYYFVFNFSLELINFLFIKFLKKKKKKRFVLLYDGDGIIEIGMDATIVK